MDKYEDIINLPHHVSEKHKHMSMYERAAQFAPYAALTGHKDMVLETSRLTEREIDLDEEEKEILDMKLRQIINKKDAKVKITYFIPDLRKDGGKYIEILENIKKIDEYKRVIVLENKTEIKIDDIIDIEEICR